MVPIRTLDPIGAIGNYWASNHVPNEEELHLLQSLADITAVTLGNVNVYAGLEQRVKDRTADLEAANKALEAFSYSVSHDLRAPLRSISGFIQILEASLKDKLSPADKATIERIAKNATHMESLIDGLLAFSKTGKQGLQKTTVPMMAIVQNISNTMLEENADRKIDFHIAPLPDACADQTLITQVWTNLIGNAVKYTRKTDQAVIGIGYEETHDSIIYCVKDNGAGFDMAYADKLFGVFQRMHSQREFEGIGVGLSLVERIVTRHDGKVWAHAKPGEGATFFFSLPKT
jgi:light-regulated signal transduction histidine kinase (bacteriophytochrome)